MLTSYRITDKESYDLILKKIHDLNEVDFVEFSGFRMGSFLAVSYYEAIHNGIDTGKKQLIKNIIRCFVKDYSYDFDSIEEGTILLFYSHEHARRDDYVRLMNDVQQMIPSSTCFTGKDIRRKVFLNRQAIKNIRLLKVWDRQLKPLESDPAIRAFLISKLSLAYRWKALLIRHSDILRKVKGLITIFDAREYENMLAQMCRKYGIKTATIEHGYFPASYYKNEFNYDLGMPFLGFVSDEFWTWGPIVQQNAIRSGINSRCVISAGYPRLIKRVGPKMNDLKNIGVILDGGKRSINTNLKMIKIALEYAQSRKMNVVIKPHPKDNTNYLSIINSNGINIIASLSPIEEFINQVDFSLCFNSSSYIDLLSAESPACRYVDSTIRNMYDYLGPEDTFQDVDSLGRVVQKLQDDINKKNRNRLIGKSSTSSKSYHENSNRLFSIV